MIQGATGGRRACGQRIIVGSPIARGLHYPSDLTEAEWVLVAPLIRPAKRGDRPRKVDVREVLNAIFYMLSTGCQWAAIPSDLPPRSTVWDYLDLWE